MEKLPKNVRELNNFFFLFVLLDPGSGMGKNPVSGSGIKIPDP
jgi:hypothetical protein